jgi:hypothetical protein
LADLATLQARRAEADAALHQLLTGTKAVVVRNAAGRYVQYAQAKVADLRAYIASLDAQIAALQGAATLARRPIRVSF